MAAAMLGAGAGEGAAAALLRLLLLLLLLPPAFRGPRLGVVRAAAAGLPDSVIWAVNAGGEAHVDVHGIHFRKDPLEGRVGRGERSRGFPAHGTGRSRRGLGPRLWVEVSPQFSQGPGQSSEPNAGSKRPRSTEAELARSYIWTSHPAFSLIPHFPLSWESKDEGGLLPPRSLTGCRLSVFLAWVVLLSGKDSS